MRRSYPSDLTDKQGERLAPLIPDAEPGVMRSVRTLSLSIGLALLAFSAAHAQVAYHVQPIATLGDTLAGIKTKTLQEGGDWEIGTLNDNGQMAIVTESAAGGEILVQYSDGQFTLIVAPGQIAPGGGRFTGGAASPVSMNQAGNIA